MNINNVGNRVYGGARAYIFSFMIGSGGALYYALWDKFHRGSVLEGIALAPVIITTASIISAFSLTGFVDGVTDMITGENHYLLKKGKNYLLKRQERSILKKNIEELIESSKQNNQ